jgi:two-component system, OmpR family, catabolic regulation response regulator CreB
VSVPRILVCEDEKSIADSLQYALSVDRFESDVVALAGLAITQLRESSYDLLLLDVGLPDASGLDACRAIRRFSDIPIIFLTARSEEIDRVLGLELGADDYISKPFSPREVVARVKAILRRGRMINTGHVLNPKTSTIGPSLFFVDDARKVITFCNQPMELTRHEFELLRFLIATPERVFDRAQIVTDVWRDETTVSERSVDVHIKILRQKLRAVSAIHDPIKTHRGFGYSISVSSGQPTRSNSPGKLDQ